MQQRLPLPDQIKAIESKLTALETKIDQILNMQSALITIKQLESAKK